MGQWFKLPTARGSMDCFACGPYYPYRLNGEKNPKFDRHCGFILTSKNSGEANFGRAVQHFSGLLEEEISGWQLMKWLPLGTDLRMSAGRPYVDVMLVPCSKAGKVSDGLTKIMTRVSTRDRRLVMHPGALVRTRDTEKRAAGGNRSVQVHRNSIAFRPARDVASLILLVDDVCTTGNSLIACCDIIQEAEPASTVVGVVLGKTTHD